jgi:hypothetical protein
MALILAGLLLGAFVANVAYGSIDGRPPLGNVAELLLLVGASVAFVTAILKHEARDGKAGAGPLPSQSEPGGTDGGPRLPDRNET